MTNTTQAVQALDKALLLAEMAASLVARLTTINALLSTVQSEKRQPTDAEFDAVYAGYDQARTKLLGDADRIDRAADAGTAHPAAA